MKAVVVRDIGKLGVDEVMPPQLGRGQLLLRVTACAICSSTDLHIVDGEDPYARLPCILGHESVGEVVELGADVEGFNIGERVVMGGAGGSRPDGLHYCYGGMAEFAVSSPERSPKIPASLAAEDAVLAFQAGECMNGVRIVQIEPTDTVAILGQGSIGLLFTQLVREKWAKKIIAIDMLEERLHVSRNLGADVVVNAAEEDSLEEVRRATGGEGADVVIDAAGAPEALRQSFKMVRRGGKILVFGYHVKPVDNLEAIEFYFREPKVFGVFSSGLTLSKRMENLRIAIRLISENRIETKPLITHVLPLSEAEQGFKYVRDKSAIKVVLKP